jgi:hypothetical protein
MNQSCWPIGSKVDRMKPTWMKCEALTLVRSNSFPFKQVLIVTGDGGGRPVGNKLSFWTVSISCGGVDSKVVLKRS